MKVSKSSFEIRNNNYLILPIREREKQNKTKQNSSSHKNLCLDVHRSLIRSSQNWNQPTCPSAVE